MGYKKPVVSEIAYRTFAINEYGMATCFILWGDSRGVLIDTGCGMYNIKEVADELCPVPYDVLITHGHGDHIGSFDRFEQVYLHPADWDTLSMDHFEENQARLKGYPDMMAAFGSFDAYEITREQIRYPESLPQLLPLEDGQVFDLGGRSILSIHTPGHTAGEMVFIDALEKIMFSGDACNPNLGISATSLNTALKGLLKVKDHEHEFNRNFNSHIGYGNSNVNMSMPASCLDDHIYIMKGMLEGTLAPEHAPSPFRKSGPPSYHYSYGNVLLTFNPDRLLDEDEEKAY